MLLDWCQSTVHDYLRRAEAAGLDRPPPPECDDGRLEQRLFGPWRVAPERYAKAAPDFAAVHEQLTTHKHVTL